MLALHEDRAGALWIGTGAGLQRLKDGSFTVYRRQDGLVHDEVRSSPKTATARSGSARRAARAASRTASSPTTRRRSGLVDELVRAIHETADGAFWFGTYGGG